jgi:hypothetical protein
MRASSASGGIQLRLFSSSSWRLTQQQHQQQQQQQQQRWEAVTAPDTLAVLACRRFGYLCLSIFFAAMHLLYILSQQVTRPAAFVCVGLHLSSNVRRAQVQMLCATVLQSLTWHPCAAAWSAVACLGGWLMTAATQPGQQQQQRQQQNERSGMRSVERRQQQQHNLGQHWATGDTFEMSMPSITQHRHGWVVTATASNCQPPLVAQR